MANVYLYELTDTWNNANLTYEAIRMVVADSASQTASMFLNFALEANANTRFGVYKSGDIHIGNTTVNIQSNGSLLKIANSTASINVALSGFAHGSFSTNGTATLLGANIFVDTVKLFVGNSTVNLIANSLIVTLANSTTVANLTSSALNLGANVVVDTVKLFAGNTTVNSIVNSSQITMSSNLFLTSAHLKVGNSTVNTTVNSSLIFTTGTLQFGTFTANTTATLTGFITVTDAGGTTRKLMCFV